jgi:hypothetical protein
VESGVSRELHAKSHLPTITMSNVVTSAFLWALIELTIPSAPHDLNKQVKENRLYVFVPMYIYVTSSP